MSNSVAGKWGYSYDGENYCGFFDTREEAIAEGGFDGRTIWVGQFRAPECEEYLDAEDLLDKVLCQDDYCGDWEGDAISPTKEQKAELTTEIRALFGRWLDRHDLRPKFGLVDNAEKIEPARSKGN